MPIFELTANVPDHINWRASVVKDRAVIRAGNEMDARLLANRKFRVAAIGPAGGPQPVPPWIDSTLVACREIEDSDWETDGPPAVLFPRSL